MNSTMMIHKLEKLLDWVNEWGFTLIGAILLFSAIVIILEFMCMIVLGILVFLPPSEDVNSACIKQCLGTYERENAL